MRVGHHEGYDRVVWDFAGSGRPTYKVHYVDTPLGDGSGDPVPVRGDAFVEVLITSVGIPAAGTPRPPDAPASALAGTVVAQAFSIYGGFEGYGQAFIGIRGSDARCGWRATNPARLVVELTPADRMPSPGAAASRPRTTGSSRSASRSRCQDWVR